MSGGPDRPRTAVPDAARRARIAVAVTFGCHAAAFATWAARIPALRDDLDLGADDLGLALGALAVGMLVGTRLTGRLERAARTGTATRIALPTLSLLLVGPALATDLPTLCLALAAFGIVGGFLDVTMNTHAVAVERLYRRPIMSSFHAMWSLGSMAGAAAAGLAARADVGLLPHFVVTGAVLAVGGAWFGRTVLPADVEQSTVAPAPKSDGSLRRVTTAVVVLIAAMGLGSFVVEGAVADWSAVFLADERSVGPGVAALGLTVFSGAMAVSRLAGDRLGLRLGPVRLGRAGAAVALVGFGLVLAVPAAWAGIAGFALLGLGIGPVVPTVFSAAGNTATRGRASVLGPVVSVAYVGGVLGPVVIGALAHRVGLPAALLLPLAFLGVILLGAPALRAAAGGSARREQHIVA